MVESQNTVQDVLSVCHARVTALDYTQFMLKLALVSILLFVGIASLAQKGAYILERRAVKVGSRSIAVTLVRASLDRVRVGVALANGLVSGNASLGQIATQAHALCAINGTFLAAYKGQTGEPYGTVAVDGKWLHLGSAGTRLDVLEDGAFQFVKDDLRVLGSLDASEQYPNNWYAYGLNQTPRNANSSYVFTPERGPRLGFPAPSAVIVSGGVITRIAQNEDVQIPAGGFVIALSGNEINQLGPRFRIGREVAYRVNSRSGQVLEGVQYSLGAGPKLVTNGSVSVDPESEGFVSSKILNERGARSAVGFRAKEILFVTMPDATVSDEAEVMRVLGATDAMNLDGGASSGLWCGKDIVPTGRKIANALVLWTK
jgi:Phosphodiester glycosidase